MSFAWYNHSNGTYNRRELRKLWLHVLAKSDEGTLVPHLITVIGRAKDRDALAIVLHEIPFVFDLMRSHEQLYKDTISPIVRR